MTENNGVKPQSQEGIDVDKLTFDVNGEADGLDDDVLDTLSGGVASDSDGNTNINCGC